MSSYLTQKCVKRELKKKMRFWILITAHVIIIIGIKHDFLCINIILLGPEGGVETRAWKARVSTPPEGPSSC